MLPNGVPYRTVEPAIRQLLPPIFPAGRVCVGCNRGAAPPGGCTVAGLECVEGVRNERATLPLGGTPTRHRTARDASSHGVRRRKLSASLSNSVTNCVTTTSPCSGIKLAPLLAQTHRTASTVNLKAGTASHQDGWAFAFAPADNDSTATDGRCVIAPEACAAQASQAGRIAREAGDILSEAMRAAGRLRLRLGHRPDPLLLAPRRSGVHAYISHSASGHSAHRQMIRRSKRLIVVDKHHFRTIPYQ